MLELPFLTLLALLVLAQVQVLWILSAPSSTALNFLVQGSTGFIEFGRGPCGSCDFYHGCVDNTTSGCSARAFLSAELS